MADNPIVVVVDGIDVLLDKLLGSGSYSDVYKGSWNSAPCAVKVFKDKIGEKYRKSFLSEAEKWSKLRHPHVVQFYGLYRDPDAVGTVGIVQEYLPYDLRKFVEKRFPKQPDENLVGFKCSILIGVALALRYMHSIKIKMAHGDLTPNNVLLTRSFQVKVTDFGNARFYDQLSSTRASYTKQAGTRDFMPPEALGEERGYKPDGFATDVFSFGCLMLFVLAQKWPEPLNKDKFKGNKVELTRSELQRRQHHIEKLGDEEKECFKVPLETCLDDDPQKREDVEWIYNQLIGMKCYDEKFQKDEYYSKILEAYVLGSGKRDEHQTEETSKNIPSDPQPEHQSFYTSQTETYQFGYVHVILILITIVLSYAIARFLKSHVFSEHFNSTS